MQRTLFAQSASLKRTSVCHIMLAMIFILFVLNTLSPWCKAAELCEGGTDRQPPPPKNVEVPEKFGLFVPPVLRPPDWVSGAEVCRGCKSYPAFYLTHYSDFFLSSLTTVFPRGKSVCTTPLTRFICWKLEFGHHLEATMYRTRVTLLYIAADYTAFFCSVSIIIFTHLCHKGLLWAPNSSSVEHISSRHYRFVHKPLCISVFSRHSLEWKKKKDDLRI